ncbi:MAG: hypothetical protein ACYT04_83145, partial [Nostoc sp.]
ACFHVRVASRREVVRQSSVTIVDIALPIQGTRVASGWRSLRREERKLYIWVMMSDAERAERLQELAASYAPPIK